MNTEFTIIETMPSQKLTLWLPLENLLTKMRGKHAWEIYTIELPTYLDSLLLDEWIRASLQNKVFILDRNRRYCAELLPIAPKGHSIGNRVMFRVLVRPCEAECAETKALPLT